MNPIYLQEIDLSEETLAHYGVLGMKWGVRRYQNPDGSLTKRGRSRYGRIEKKYNKKLSRAQKYTSDISKARAKRDAKLEYRVKTAKNEKQRARRSNKLQDFREGTKIIYKADKKYENVIKNYKNAKLSAIKNPEVKSSWNYKIAKTEYANQKVSDLMAMGGSAGTRLGYATDMATGRHEWTVNRDRLKKQYDRKHSS